MRNADNIKRRAATGDLDAICTLADLYVRGRLPGGDRAALPWLRKAAGRGSAWAQYSIGLAYDHGYGVGHSRPQAIKWYQRAAAQGYDSAQLNLGIILANLPGARRDLTAAIHLYRLAAKQGNRNAAYNLGLYYELGRGLKRNRAVAIRWYLRAASRGDRKAARAAARLNAVKMHTKATSAGA